MYYFCKNYKYYKHCFHLEFVFFYLIMLYIDLSMHQTKKGSQELQILQKLYPFGICIFLFNNVIYRPIHAPNQKRFPIGNLFMV